MKAHVLVTSFIVACMISACNTHKDTVVVKDVQLEEIVHEESKNEPPPPPPPPASGIPKKSKYSKDSLARKSKDSIQHR